MSQKTHLLNPHILQLRHRSEMLSDLLKVTRQFRGRIDPLAPSSELLTLLTAPASLRLSAECL